ncbi:hypothetical protein [Dietzia cinnamea]|uniref:Uncharacterized protein n=1 Tax=Dietzia cinnamea TaxID=321318 RepID=A0A4R4A032_9ACTN|nr:hypothetical protein [Dietzia cinnamea]TCW26861.1 hypothetical protein EDD19_101281 [Dietzia cinnamea]
MSEGREHGRRAGTDEGTATHHTGIIGRAEPSADRPGATVIHQDETTKVVAFEFAEGQELVGISVSSSGVMLRGGCRRC